MESFYVSAHEETDHTPKQNLLIIIGDWNTKVEKKADLNIVGKFGLGLQNGNKRTNPIS